VKLDDPVETSKLCHPQAIAKFCFFLIDALKEKGARMKLLICACLAKETKKVLVVVVCGKARLGAVQGNAFGNALRSAAEEIGADYFWSEICIWYGNSHVESSLLLLSVFS
jgi:cell division control protein 45